MSCFLHILKIKTVKHIYIYWTVNALHSAILTQLPIHEVHIWSVLTISCYPHIVVSLQVIGEILLDETLTDVEYGLYPPCLLHCLQPRPDILEHFLLSACLTNQTVAWLYIEHWWQVTLMVTGILKEVLRLFGTRCL